MDTRAQEVLKKGLAWFSISGSKITYLLDQDALERQTQAALDDQDVSDVLALVRVQAYCVNLDK